MNFSKVVAKKIYVLVLITLLFCSEGGLIFAAPKNKKSKQNYSGQVKTTYNKTESENEKEEPKTEIDTVVAEKTSVTLTPQKRTFFSKIDPSILAGVENGSPESLQLAMSKLRKSESDYEENEKILISIASEIMKIVWPSEKITWDVFPVTKENSYLGAIDSANKGVFDLSTGNSDFLSIVLPTLVLLKPTATDSVYEPCEKALKSALELNVNSVLANYLAGILYLKTKNYQKSVIYLQKAYDSVKNNREVALNFSKALRLSGDYDLASKILSEINDSEIDILKQKAYLAFAQKDIAASEEFVAKVLQQTPNDLEFLLFRAKILIEKNDYIHAVSLLDMYARQDSSSLEYLLLRARVQFDWSKNASAATETIEKALELYPDNEEVFMFAAKISSSTDSKVAGYYADELASKILEKNPDNITAMYYALEGLMQRKNWQESYLISNKILQKGLRNSDHVYDHVQICINLGKETEAYEYAKSVYMQIPNDELVLEAYIYAYSKVGNKEEVKKYIDSLLQTATPKLKSFLYYVKSFLQNTEELILSDLRSSLISNPRNSDALFRLYEIYFNKKDYRKAQYYLRQVVAINPNDVTFKKLNEELSSLMN